LSIFLDASNSATEPASRIAELRQHIIIIINIIIIIIIIIAIIIMCCVVQFSTMTPSGYF